MRREDSKWIQRGCTREWWLGIKEDGVPPTSWRHPPLPQHERQAFLATLSRREIEEFFRDWRVWGRDNQLPPEGDWDTWLLKCGRGFGKTRTAVETINDWVKEGWAQRIAIVGQGEDDIRRTMIEGVSGFLLTACSWERPSWRPSAGGGILQWPNGCQGFVFSAADSEGLRGPEFNAGWFDEPMAVPPTHRNRTMANLEFCLRLGEHPRLILTTTPKPDVWLRKMLRDAKNPENKIVVTEGSLHDNAENLPVSFRKKVERNYRGTRLGRQEIDGELLTDEEGALWTEDMLDKRRMPEADPVEFAATCDKVVVSVDPNTKNSVGSSKARKIAHAAGIVVCGKKGPKRSVLADRSTKGGPNKWVPAVVDAVIEFDADEIVVEVNQGGDMAKLLIYRELADRGMSCHIHTNFAKKSKEGRAEPVARMYERNEVIHVGPASEYELLEMQMVYLHEEDDPTGEDFDRCDAMVWGITRLGLKKKAFSGSGRGGVGIMTMGDFRNGAAH